MLVGITEPSFSIHFYSINAGYLIVTMVIFKSYSYHDTVFFLTSHDCIRTVIFKSYLRQSLSSIRTSSVRASNSIILRVNSDLNSPSIPAITLGSVMIFQENSSPPATAHMPASIAPTSHQLTTGHCCTCNVLVCPTSAVPTGTEGRCALSQNQTRNMSIIWGRLITQALAYTATASDCNAWNLCSRFFSW